METQSDSSPGVSLQALQPRGPITGILQGNEAPDPMTFCLAIRSIGVQSLFYHALLLLGPPCPYGPKGIIKEEPGFHPHCASLPSESPRDTARLSSRFLFQRRDLRCILFGPRPFTRACVQEQARASPTSHFSHSLLDCPLSALGVTVVVHENVSRAHYCAVHLV